MLCKQLYMYLHLLRFFKCLLQYQRSEFPNTGKCLSTILGLVQGLFAVNYYIFFNSFFFWQHSAGMSLSTLLKFRN